MAKKLASASATPPPQPRQLADNHARAWNLSLHVSKTSWSWLRFCSPRQSASPSRSAAQSTHQLPMAAVSLSSAIGLSLSSRRSSVFFTVSAITSVMAGLITSICDTPASRTTIFGEEIARLRLEQAALSEDAIQGHGSRHARLPTALCREHGSRAGHRHQRKRRLARPLHRKGSKDGLKPDRRSSRPTGSSANFESFPPHFPSHSHQRSDLRGRRLLAYTRLRAILRGSISGQISSTTSPPTRASSPASRSLRSGGDQVYPRGLPVGTIQSIKPDPDHQPYTLIELRPAANLIGSKRFSSLRARSRRCLFAAQHDLAVGAATAEAQAAAKQAADQQAAAEAAAKSAAQVVADRLPSLHDPDQVERWRCQPSDTRDSSRRSRSQAAAYHSPGSLHGRNTPRPPTPKPGAAERNTPIRCHEPTTVLKLSTRDYPTTGRHPLKPKPQPSTGVGPTSDWQLTTIN